MRRSSVRVRPVAPRAEISSAFYFCLIYQRLSWAKLRARPVDDEASKMRWRNKEQYEAPQTSSATMFLRDEQRIRNAQVVGSSPTISSKTCVNIVFSQVLLFYKFQISLRNNKYPPA